VLATGIRWPVTRIGLARLVEVFREHVEGGGTGRVPDTGVHAGRAVVRVTEHLADRFDRNTAIEHQLRAERDAVLCGDRTHWSATRGVLLRRDEVDSQFEERESRRATD
jgi:hypothetical protein